MNFFQVRKTHDLSDTDPFNSEVFPQEIQEAILSYLPVLDLLNATTVSKLWNNVIGASSHFKKSVVIRLHHWNDAASEIKKSDRSYEIISIADFKMRSKKLQYLEDKDWKTVTLNIGSIESQSKFVNIMKVFRNVRDLKILCTNIAQLKKNPTIVLNDLENLVLSDVTLDLFDVLMVKHPSLKSLSVRFLITDVKSPRTVAEALIEFLNLNNTIKDLEMNYVVTNDFFKLPVPLFSALKLKNVTIGFNENRSIRSNVESFLKSQGNSIERLKFVVHQEFSRQETYEWRYWDIPVIENDRASDDVTVIYQIWNFMTALNEINFRFLQNSAELPENKELNELMKTLKPNVNVTKFNFQFMDVEAPKSVIMNIMKFAPNLQSIYVTKLSSAVVRYAARNLRALRSLKCYDFADDVEAEYQRLKSSTENVNKFIVIRRGCALG